MAIQSKLTPFNSLLNLQEDLITAIPCLRPVTIQHDPYSWRGKANKIALKLRARAEKNFPTMKSIIRISFPYTRTQCQIDARERMLQKEGWSMYRHCLPGHLINTFDWHQMDHKTRKRYLLGNYHLSGAEDMEQLKKEFTTNARPLLPVCPFILGYNDWFNLDLLQVIGYLFMEQRQIIYGKDIDLVEFIQFARDVGYSDAIDLHVVWHSKADGKPAEKVVAYFPVEVASSEAAAAIGKDILDEEEYETFNHRGSVSTPAQNGNHFPIIQSPVSDTASEVDSTEPKELGDSVEGSDPAVNPTPLERSVLDYTSNYSPDPPPKVVRPQIVAHILPWETEEVKSYRKVKADLAAWKFPYTMDSICRLTPHKRGLLDILNSKSFDNPVISMDSRERILGTSRIPPLTTMGEKGEHAEGRSLPEKYQSTRKEISKDSKILLPAAIDTSPEIRSHETGSRHETWAIVAAASKDINWGTNRPEIAGEQASTADSKIDCFAPPIKRKSSASSSDSLPSLTSEDTKASKEVLMTPQGSADSLQVVVVVANESKTDGDAELERIAQKL